MSTSNNTHCHSDPELMNDSIFITVTARSFWSRPYFKKKMTIRHHIKQINTKIHFIRWKVTFNLKEIEYDSNPVRHSKKAQCPLHSDAAT